MTIVTVDVAKMRLSELVAAAERGEEVLILRDGKAVARIIKYGEPAP